MDELITAEKATEITDKKWRQPIIDNEHLLGRINTYIRIASNDGFYYVLVQLPELDNVPFASYESVLQKIENAGFKFFLHEKTFFWEESTYIIVNWH